MYVVLTTLGVRSGLGGGGLDDAGEADFDGLDGGGRVEADDCAEGAGLGQLERSSDVDYAVSWGKRGAPPLIGAGVPSAEHTWMCL